jgi:CelD/BcsL family acetyltransferase involved in cellulose biosynthesis
MTSFTVRECAHPSAVGAPEAWDALVAMPPATVSGSRAWLTAAFASAHPEAVPLLLVVEANDHLVGLLPLALYECRSSPTVRFAGSPHNDLSDVLALPGYREQAAAAILETLRSFASRGWSVQLDSIDPDGALAAADRGSCALVWMPDQPAPFIDLGGTWRFAASSRRRSQWNRRLGRLRDRHTVKFRRLEGHEMVRELPEFVRLREARRQATGREDQPPLEFLRHAVRELAPSGRCVLTEMVIDGRAAAADLYLVDDRVALMWLRGLDPCWEKFPCGHLLLRASAEQFAAEGFDILDLGRGAEPYKFVFGAERRVLLRGICQSETVTSVAAQSPPTGASVSREGLRQA